jgi:hypothetical protein
MRAASLLAPELPVPARHVNALPSRPKGAREEATQENGTDSVDHLASPTYRI